MGVHQIYLLAGKFLSEYFPVNWAFKGKESSDDKIYTAPTPAIALFKKLREEGKEVKLTVLVPHSLPGFGRAGVDLTDLEALKKVFAEDFLNYHQRIIELLKNRLRGTDTIKQIKGIHTQIENFLRFAEIAVNEEITTLEKLTESESDLEAYKDEMEKLLNSPKVVSKLQTLDEEFKKLFKGRLEVVVIPSVGRLRVGKTEVDYKIDYPQRVAYNYLNFAGDFLELLEQQKGVNVYLDVSTGLNALVVETLEAYNSAIVFWNFYFLAEEQNRGKFCIIAADPITGVVKPEEIKNFTTEEIKRLAFFEKPITWKKYQEEYKSKFNNIKGLTGSVKQSIYMFNAIKYNAPLAFTIAWFKPPKDMLKTLKSSIKSLQNFSKFKFNQSQNNTLIVELQNKYTFAEIRNVTYTVMLGINLTRSVKKFLTFMKEENNKLVSNPTRGLEFSFNELRNLEDENKSDPWGFEKLYNKCGLINNALFLRNELNSIYRKISNHFEYRVKRKDSNNNCLRFCQLRDFYSECKNPKEDIYRQLLNLKSYRSFEWEKTLGFKNRNFLAHCGFEDNITELCKDDETDKYYIRYLTFEDKEVQAAFDEFIKYLILEKVDEKV